MTLLMTFKVLSPVIPNSPSLYLVGSVKKRQELILIVLFQTTHLSFPPVQARKQALLPTDNPFGLQVSSPVGNWPLRWGMRELARG